MNLVHKDQLEILATLRESVNEDKAALESEVQQLHSQIRDLSDKNKMQLEQINGLLLEKITLQSDGIGQREKMLERERNFRQDIGFSREADANYFVATYGHQSTARMSLRMSRRAC